RGAGAAKEARAGPGRIRGRDGRSGSELQEETSKQEPGPGGREPDRPGGGRIRSGYEPRPGDRCRRTQDRAAADVQGVDGGEDSRPGGTVAAGRGRRPAAPPPSRHPVGRGMMLERDTLGTLRARLEWLRLLGVEDLPLRTAESASAA